MNLFTHIIREVRNVLSSMYAVGAVRHLIQEASLVVAAQQWPTSGPLSFANADTHVSNRYEVPPPDD
jgi:hypothetical protein